MPPKPEFNMEQIVAAGLEDTISFVPRSNPRTKFNREKTSLKVI